MKINTLKIGNFYTIHLDGDLDASSSLGLDNTIQEALEQKENKIVIDCRNLDYVSSAGLGVFISYLSEFEVNEIYFALMNVKDNIINTLKILGLERLVNIIDKLPDD